MTDYTKILAAIRDPKTKKVYSGESHQEIVDKADTISEALRDRLMAEYGRVTENTGFIDADGLFYTRMQALKKWGIMTSQDLKEKRRYGR